MNRRVELFRPFQGAILLVHLNISRSRHVVRIQALNVQLNIVTWSSLVHSLMMHLHSEHFLSVRIQNRVRWQEYDFFAWLHKLHSSTSLDLSEWGTSNFFAPAVFLYGALVLLLRCGRHLLGRRISRLGIPATHCERVCFIHCTSSRSGNPRERELPEIRGAPRHCTGPAQPDPSSSRAPSSR